MGNIKKKAQPYCPTEVLSGYHTFTYFHGLYGNSQRSKPGSGLLSCHPDKISRRERYAGFEYRLYDDSLVDTYNFFIFEVVKADVAVSPKHPETLHYTGDGVFMVSCKINNRKKLFSRGML